MVGPPPSEYQLYWVLVAERAVWRRSLESIRRSLIFCRSSSRLMNQCSDIPPETRQVRTLVDKRLRDAMVELVAAGAVRAANSPSDSVILSPCQPSAARVSAAYIILR